jgi:hypothetical protein
MRHDKALFVDKSKQLRLNRANAVKVSSYILERCKKLILTSACVFANNRMR